MAYIFVVDDDSVLLGLISMALRLDGHDVKTISDPVAARDTIAGECPPMDLFITDAEMAPISGFQLVKSLDDKCITCPVIFISEHHGLATVISQSMGYRAVIEKPFTAPVLRAGVQKALAAAKPASPNVGTAAAGTKSRSADTLA